MYDEHFQEHSFYGWAMRKLGTQEFACYTLPGQGVYRLAVGNSIYRLSKSSLATYISEQTRTVIPQDF
jgi:hypothetical protein